MIDKVMQLNEVLISELAAANKRVSVLTSALRGLIGTLEQCVICPICMKINCPTDCDLHRSRKALLNQKDGGKSGQV